MVWFAATVPLGDRTLLQHLRAIAGTPEARSLGEGARDEAGKMGERLRRELSDHDAAIVDKPAPDRPAPDRPPAEKLDESDRRQLNRVIRDRTGTARPRAH